MRFENKSDLTLSYMESNKGKVVKTKKRITIRGIIEKSVLQLRLDA
jgi:hypothetical protein